MHRITSKFWKLNTLKRVNNYNFFKNNYLDNGKIFYFLNGNILT